MKKYFALIVFAALAAVSCTDSLSEDKASVSNNGTVFTLRLAPITKATVDVSGSTYDLKWTDGDKIAFKLSDDSTVESSVSVSGSKATVSVDLTGGKTIVDAWYPSNSMVKPAAIAEYQSATSVNVPLQMSSLSGNTITFEDIVPWAVVRVSLSSPSATRIGSARTLSFVKLKNNNAGHSPESVQINTAETLSDAVLTYDFVVPVADGNTFEVIVRDSDGKEYRRKQSSTADVAARKVFTLPQINDVDDTGKHVWYFGTSNGANTSESPLNYWYPGTGGSTMDHTTYADHATVTTADQSSGSMTKFRGDLRLILNKAYSSDGSSTSTARSTAFPQYYGANKVAAGQVPFVAVHTGNYPVFAVKMSNPTKFGSSRNLALDTASDGPDGLTDPGLSGNVGNGNNKYTFLSSADEAADVSVLYYNLSGQTFATKSAPNTMILPFKTWQFKFADIQYASAQVSAPTYDVYWAGFFNSVSELEAFAAAH